MLLRWSFGLINLCQEQLSESHTIKRGERDER